MLFLIGCLLFTGCAVHPVLPGKMIIAPYGQQLKSCGKSLQIGKVQMVEAFNDRNYPAWNFETEFIPPLRTALTQSMKNSGLFEKIIPSGNADFVLDVQVDFRTGTQYSFRGGFPAVGSKISNFYTFYYVLKSRADNRTAFECVIEKGCPIDKKVPLTSRLARNSEIIVKANVGEFLIKLAKHLEKL